MTAFLIFLLIAAIVWLAITLHEERSRSHGPLSDYARARLEGQHNLDAAKEELREAERRVVEDLRKGPEG